MTVEEAYRMPRKFRSCMNCIHLDGPQYRCGPVCTGGCREKFDKYGIKDLRRTYCGQWFLKPISEEY